MLKSINETTFFYFALFSVYQGCRLVSEDTSMSVTEGKIAAVAYEYEF